MSLEDHHDLTYWADDLAEGAVADLEKAAEEDFSEFSRRERAALHGFMRAHVEADFAAPRGGGAVYSRSYECSSCGFKTSLPRVIYEHVSRYHRSKPLLVGESNPYGGDPRHALYPLPEQSAGGRLCYRILGYDRAAAYVRDFDRANLCARRWSQPGARRRAWELCEADRPAVVLLGARVASAFGVAFEPFAVHRWRYFSVVVLPHPSGLNRMWNEPGAYERARAALQEGGVVWTP